MIFFFYGEDSFRSHQKIKTIIDKFKTNVGGDGHNVDFLDGDTITIENFYNSVRSGGFLALKKLIIIRDIFNNKKLKDIQDEIIKFLKTQEDTAEENYIIFWQAGKADARSKLYKALKKFKFTEEFSILSSPKLISWIKKEVEKNKKSIDTQAINLLLTFVGNNLWQLHQEINKLSNYCEKEIKEKDVKKLVHAKTDDNIFNLVDAIGNKNKGLSLSLIEEQLDSGVAVQYIITMIIRQFRLIIKVKSFTEDKITQDWAIAQALGMHSFVAKKISQQCKAFELNKLKKIYQQLLLIDEKIKLSSNQEKILLLNMINLF